MTSSDNSKMKFHGGQVTLLSAGHAVHDTYSAFLPPLLPVFIERLAMSRTEAGLLTVFLQAPSLIQPLIGYWADRYHLHRLMFLTPAITAALMSLIGVPGEFSWLSLLLVLAGVSSAAIHAVGPVMVGKVSGPFLGRGMSFWMVGGEMGRTLGPLVVVTAVAHLTLNGLPWLMVAGIVASLLLGMQFLRVSVEHKSDEKALHWLPAMKGMRWFLLPLSGIIIGRAFMMASLTTYLPTFLTEQGASLWLAGASLTLLQAAGVAGALVSGSLSDRLGRRLMLIISFTVTPAAMALLLLLGSWARLPVLLLAGLTGISTTPVIMALVQETFPESRALANGVYMCLSFGLRSVVVIIVGLLGDHLGMVSAFWISGGVMLLTMPFIWKLPVGGDRVRK